MYKKRKSVILGFILCLLSACGHDSITNIGPNNDPKIPEQVAETHSSKFYGCPTSVDSSAPAIPICTAKELDAIRDNLSGNYVLVCDINLAGMNWVPIIRRYNHDGFSGSFSGKSGGKIHAISNLTINSINDGTFYHGLFGSLCPTGKLSDIVLKNVSVNVVNTLSGNTGNSGVVGWTLHVGALVGEMDGGSIENSSSSGIVSSNTGGDTGGLIGRNHEGKITGSSTSGSVSARSLVGGLVGFNVMGEISNSSSSSAVTGIIKYEADGWGVGGLIGIMHGGSVLNSHASGPVVGTISVGKLIGGNASFWGGTYNQCTATGSISSQDTFTAPDQLVGRY